MSALLNCSINKFQDSIIDQSYSNDLSLQGHNIYGTPYFCTHIESFTNIKPIINILNTQTVFTNHGIHLKNVENPQWTISSTIRKNIIENELNNNKINTYSNLLDLLNINYNHIDTIYHPYRCNEVYTSSQLLMDLNNKIFIFNYDINKCDYMGIINKLPQNYQPKIKIFINKITKKFI